MQFDPVRCTVSRNIGVRRLRPCCAAFVSGYQTGDSSCVDPFSSARHTVCQRSTSAVCLIWPPRHRQEDRPRWRTRGAAAAAAGPAAAAAAAPPGDATLPTVRPRRLPRPAARRPGTNRKDARGGVLQSLRCSGVHCYLVHTRMWRWLMLVTGDIIADLVSVYLFIYLFIARHWFIPQKYPSVVSGRCLRNSLLNWLMFSSRILSWS